MNRRPTPHDPPTYPRADAWGLVGGYYLPPGCAPASGGVSAVASGGIPASPLAYAGPGHPAASGDATQTAAGAAHGAGRWAPVPYPCGGVPADPRPDRALDGPGGGGHP